MSNINYDEIREKTLESLAGERDEEREAKEAISERLAVKTIAGWRRIYMRKNQPNNYIRITRTQVAPEFCACALQMWVRRKIETTAHLEESHIINEATFQHLSGLPAYKWETTTNNARQLHRVMWNKSEQP